MSNKNGEVRLTMNGRTQMPPLSAIRRADELQLSDPKRKVALGVLLLLVMYVCVYEAVVLGVVTVICLVTLVIASMLMNSVMSLPLGDDKMRSISSAIREGSDSFFWRVYGTISKLTIPMSFVIFLLYLLRTPTNEFKDTSSFVLSMFIAFSFVTGALCSSVAGFIGLYVSTRVNGRVAAAAVQKDYGLAVRTALRGGAVAAVAVVALVLLGITLLFIVGASIYESTISFARVPFVLVGFGFGASFVALFAQLGGGIFTKAADVGADLVGKVEQDIPEDDPRNPAVIADLVGDNVGDCSARGADLFESISAEIIAAMILGGTLSTDCGLSESEIRGYVLFPLLVHAFDLVVSLCGVFYARENESDVGDNPLTILKRGFSVALGLAVFGFALATRWLLYAESAPNAWFHFFLCGLVGMATAYAVIRITQYYTDYDHRPVKSIAKASTTGHATNIIAGLAVGMESVFLPTCVICVAIISAHLLGSTSGLKDTKSGANLGGLFGTAVATMGMLSTAVFILGMDFFGPISDNAGGIVEMSAQSDDARTITDRLDAVGNTTKAATKGFAVSSAGLASFLLVRAFMDEVVAIHESDTTSTSDAVVFESIDVAQPEVFVGGCLGAATVFLFASMAMNAVGDTAQAVVREVRRQFRELPGIRTGDQKPEYAACVDIVSKEALRGMIAPGVLASFSPIITGLFFRLYGTWIQSEEDDGLLGARSLCGFMVFSTVSSILLALVLNNAGGAWDNTKKLIETGAHGGKNSGAHKASITGDTVGDPAKDTAGPSLHVLMKMISTVTLVMAPMFVASGK